jgi:transcriptional regulator with XRE-family HTH domain
MKKEQNSSNSMGYLIKAAREEMNLSQSELAEKLGFQSATAISLMESDERNVNSIVLQQIAQILHRDIKYFLGEDEKNLDVRVALRADKDISKEDKEALLRFVDLAKQKKNAR